MVLTGRRALEVFKKRNAQARGPINAWVKRIKLAKWGTMAELKDSFPSASIMVDNMVVFNLGGNNYRLQAQVILAANSVTVVRIGTHAEYDKWEPGR